MDNNMHSLVFDIPMVLAYLIHEMNESMKEQDRRVAWLDQVH